MFIINLIPLHVFVLLLMQRYSRRVYIGKTRTHSHAHTHTLNQPTSGNTRPVGRNSPTEAKIKASTVSLGCGGGTRASSPHCVSSHPRTIIGQSLPSQPKEKPGRTVLFSRGLKCSIIGAADIHLHDRTTALNIECNQLLPHAT